MDFLPTNRAKPPVVTSGLVLGVVLYTACFYLISRFFLARGYLPTYLRASIAIPLLVILAHIVQLYRKGFSTASALIRRAILFSMCIALFSFVIVAWFVLFPYGYYNFMLNNTPETLIQCLPKQPCTFGSCFDHSPPRECSADRFLVYIYPYTAEEEKSWDPAFKQFIHAFESEAEITQDPSEACLLIPAIDTGCSEDHCFFAEGVYSPPYANARISAALRALPYWNRGRNHVLLDASDPSCTPYETDEAQVWKTSFSLRNYRPGFDVAFPLGHNWNRVGDNLHYSPEERRRPMSERETLLLFKGSLWWAPIRIQAREKLHNAYVFFSSRFSFLSLSLCLLY
jgi:hypothetical protein